jgi:hypothetical protein
MRAGVLTILAGVTAASANPFAITFFSEVCAMDGHDWVEFYLMPGGVEDSMHLNGVVLETMTTSCTLDFVLWRDSFVVLDSASIASGEMGRGTFALDPDSDFIVMRDDSLGFPHDEIHYPAEPGGYGSRPPGNRASISRVYVLSHYYSTINWYIDSTPTPGAPNDDYSIIRGAIRGSGGQVPDYFVIESDGPNGVAYDESGMTTDYEIIGLSAGKYRVRAFDVGIRGQRYTVEYPDSVELGYSDVVEGIDLIIPLAGIRESEVSLRPALLGPGVLLDVSGRRVMELGPGENDIRQLQPGAFFLRREEDDYTHKVVVQR